MLIETLLSGCLHLSTTWLQQSNHRIKCGQFFVYCIHSVSCCLSSLNGFSFPSVVFALNGAPFHLKLQFSVDNSSVCRSASVSCIFISPCYSSTHGNTDKSSGPNSPKCTCSCNKSMQIKSKSCNSAQNSVGHDGICSSPVKARLAGLV